MFGRKKGKTPDPHATRNALILLGVIVAAGIGLRVHQALIQREPVTRLFVVNSGTITAEIADTPEKKELGLGERDELAPRHGMYFPFPAARKWVFWMKGMRFPIDVIWIREGVVVDVTYDARPPEGGPIQQFSPSEDADAVLEINAGEARELNVKKGDLIKVR